MKPGRERANHDCRRYSPPAGHHHARGFCGFVRNQRERFVSALVQAAGLRCFIFAAGFRQVLGVSIIPPYETYVLVRGLHHAWPVRA